MISPYFTIEELTQSETAARLGIDNTPTPELLAHAEKFLLPGLDQVRAFLDRPVHINSGYRSIQLNAAIPGSSNTSQHTKFEAADITSPAFGTPLQIAKALIGAQKEGKILFDQLIYEYDAWVHISFAEKPRGSVISKHKGTSYLVGLVDRNGKPL